MAALTHGRETRAMPALVPQFGKSAALVLGARRRRSSWSASAACRLRPTDLMLVASLIAALALVLVHLFGPRIRFLSSQPRSRWLSGAGGASVAYVFVQLLPEIADAQRTIERHVRGALALLDRHAYVLALFGLAVFYGLERMTLTSRAKEAGMATDRPVRAKDEPVAAGPGAFALSMGSFAVYNVLLGYVLARSERTPLALVLYALAIAFHFLVTDFGLREHHKQRYDAIGRWILAASVGGGVALGWTMEVPEALVVAILAFLAGGIVLNVLKEELPAERRSRFWAFAAGAGAYAAVLLAL